MEVSDDHIALLIGLLREPEPDVFTYQRKAAPPTPLAPTPRLERVARRRDPPGPLAISHQEATRHGPDNKKTPA